MLRGVLFKALLNLALEVVGRGGYLGVFVLMALESALIPIPSEIVVPLAGFLAQRGEMDLLAVTLAATLGNLAGSIGAYLLGLKVGRGFVEKYGRYLLISREHLSLADRLFKEHGSKIILAGRMMLAVRTVISLPAGVAGMNLLKFVVYTFLGSIPWNLALAYAGYVLGENWVIVEEYMAYLDALIIAAAVMSAVYLLLRVKHSPQET